MSRFDPLSKAAPRCKMTDLFDVCPLLLCLAVDGPHGLGPPRAAADGPFAAVGCIVAGGEGVDLSLAGSSFRLGS